MKKSLPYLGASGKFLLLLLAVLPPRWADAQILMSSGTNYSQNFDSLAASGSSNPWTDNSTLPGWYAAKSSAAATVYAAGPGTSNSGGLYSFGTNGVLPATDRALGSLGSGTASPVAYGLRFTNDTGLVISNISISYTGEQWRNGGNGSPSSLVFSYGLSSGMITNAYDAATWINFTALDFITPTVGTNAGALDGNNPTNRQTFNKVVLNGVAVIPGREFFIRWSDQNDAGNDDGLAIDDLTVTFQTVTNGGSGGGGGGAGSNLSPVIVMQPLPQATTVGGMAIFSVTATSTSALTYQWLFNGTNLPGQNGSSLALFNVSSNQAGEYLVQINNGNGVTNSAAVPLCIHSASLLRTNGSLRYLTYNVAGNGTTDWSTNAGQVQAIGRELIYLDPDIVTFNEIPYTNTWQMANWVKAFLPGFYLATNSATDGSIRSVVASRFPIARSQSWLSNSSLAPYGYSGSGFTRDLFEAQLTLPNWPWPLHVFVAHLKATTGGQDDYDRRAAMGSAVSNFFASTFLTGTNGAHPYILSGDMNEDCFFPDAGYTSGQPIQRIVSPPTGLRLTTPVNPYGHSLSNAYTESIRGSLDTRFDYILPCALLFSNITGSQVFRTDLLPALPPNLLANDDKTASDHLPVLMEFNNPFNSPFALTSVLRTNQSLTLKWDSQNNRTFNIEASSNLLTWTPWVTNLHAANSNTPFVFATNNVSDGQKFFRIYRVP